MSGTLRLGIDARKMIAGAREARRANEIVERSSKKATGSIDGTEKSFGAAAKKAAVYGAALLAVAGTASVLVRQIFRLGSALEESSSKFVTVFGSEVGKVNDFLDEFAEKAGLSRREAQDLTSGFGNLTQAMGFTRLEAAGMSEDVIRLAADIASFSNVQGGTERVATAIKSALNGEREALKLLDIQVRENEVAERAIMVARQRGSAEVDKQAKAIATLQLITESAGFALGDIERTQDSAANQSRQLGAAWRTMRDALSEDVMPILALYIPLLKDIVLLTASATTGTAEFVRTMLGSIGALDVELEAAIQSIRANSAEAADPKRFLESRLAGARAELEDLEAALRSNAADVVALEQQPRFKRGVGGAARFDLREEEARIKADLDRTFQESQAILTVLGEVAAASAADVGGAAGDAAGKAFAAAIDREIKKLRGLLTEIGDPGAGLGEFRAAFGGFEGDLLEDGALVGTGQGAFGGFVRAATGRSAIGNPLIGPALGAPSERIEPRATAGLKSAQSFLGKISEFADDAFLIESAARGIGALGESILGLPDAVIEGLAGIEEAARGVRAIGAANEAEGFAKTAGLIGGGASILGGAGALLSAFTSNPEKEASKQALKDNTKAILRLTESALTAANFREARGAATDFLEGGKQTAEDLRLTARAARELGIELVKWHGHIIPEAYEDLVEAINAAEAGLTSFGEGLQGLEDMASLRNEVFDIESDAQSQLTGTLGIAQKLAPELFGGLEAGTEAGRDQIESALRGLVEEIESGTLTLEELGGFRNLQELISVILSLDTSLDEMRDGVDAVTRSLSNIPQVLPLAFLRFQAGGLGEGGRGPTVLDDSGHTSTGNPTVIQNFEPGAILIEGSGLDPNELVGAFNQSLQDEASRGGVNSFDVSIKEQRS